MLVVFVSLQALKAIALNFATVKHGTQLGFPNKPRALNVHISLSVDMDAT